MARLAENKQTGERKILGYYRTKSDALTALAEFNSNPYDLVEANMTVEAIWNNIKETVRASDARKKVYDRVFKKYMQALAVMPIKDVRTAHLQKILDECQYGYSTKSNIRTVMKHIFRYAAQNDLVKQDYTEYIEFEQEATQIERVVYTSEEIADLWKHTEIEDYVTTLILLHQGMRIKELRDCTKDWINLEEKTIDIKIAKNAQSIRKVPINEKVFPLIKKLYDESKDEYLLHDRKNQYEYFVKKMLGHTPYDARHTFASKANELGLKTVVIQRLMGHKPDTLLEQVYIHLSMEELSEAINQITY